jgi:hypothetical protein
MMTIKDRVAWEILEENERSDYFNKNSLLSVGVDDLSQFGFANPNAKKTTKKINIKNSKEGLYTKLEISALRRRYVTSCNKDADTGTLKNDRELLLMHLSQIETT